MINSGENKYKCFTIYFTNYNIFTNIMIPFILYNLFYHVYTFTHVTTYLHMSQLIYKYYLHFIHSAFASIVQFRPDCHPHACHRLNWKDGQNICCNAKNVYYINNTTTMVHIYKIINLITGIGWATNYIINTSGHSHFYIYWASRQCVALRAAVTLSVSVLS